MQFKKSTAVLFVEEAEPCIEFWTQRFGFTKTMDVPEGDKIGFAILAKDGVELMYQTYSSAEKDVPSIPAQARRGKSFLFLEVEGLDAIRTAAEGTAQAFPERTTFYGSRELGVHDPAGHVITFAEF